MGKRKAVDPPAPPDDIKKQKKRPRKPVNKIARGGPKPLDDIDLLFEEVEAILNSELATHESLPQKKPSPQPKRILEFFNKRKKGQTVDPGKLINSVEKLPNVNVTIPPIQQGIVAYSSTTKFSQTQGISHTEEPEHIPFPLSHEIRLVPNLPCRNRFEPLTGEGDLTEAHDHLTVEPVIESAIPPPINATCSELLASEVNMSLILHRVDEVRNLLLQLTKFLQGKMAQPRDANAKSQRQPGKEETWRPN
ncbi:hypothetical protein NDU88_001927 [Pleurodeles waltl]|uniref:Uncharacterized protein n=1 Tax=Pleurodeles waltl TaxID=8319 RepID=A0AAV7NC51_PLEWA|nr:hypothetical protein NDU88_001927 [Pleurodeles waltl]